MDLTIPRLTERRRAYLELFAISFVALFLELACIRWFGSTVAFLTFFTNLVLMACFLGLSVGLMAAGSEREYWKLTLPVGLAAALLARWSLWAHEEGGQILVEVGGRGSPQEVYFGTEFLARSPSALLVPIEVMAGVFFVLIALIFVGVGQLMGRKFNAIPDRVPAYSADVLGSLAGIVAFGLASKNQTSPLLWFAVAAGAFAVVIPRRSALQVACLVAWLYVAALSAFGAGEEARQTRWSPYYKVEYEPKLKLIETNNIGHQQMVDVHATGKAYLLPHLLFEAAGGEPFREVLVIGAGSGNDVAAALMAGAEHVDAVEIDPALQALGRRDHPNRPYQDPRVTVHLTDGRGFLRSTDKQYDLIVYALVDSLVLHSGYTSLRLESFLFTDQAIRDIRARLKPGGVFAAYNYYRQGWVVGRIDRMIADAFGTPPLVFSLPPQAVIRPDEPQTNHVTFLMAGDGPTPALDAAREHFGRGQALAYRQDPEAGTAEAEFVPADRPGDLLTPATVVTEGIDRVPTDSWPFLYLKERAIPALNLRGMSIVAALSTALLLIFAPSRRLRPDGQMFFLGAGFMLLETKGVVHMALLFGATWAVNSIVFGAILVMILLANLYVVLTRPGRFWPFYVGLIAALLANVLVPLETYLGLPDVARMVVSCAVVFLPVLFAGIVFAMAFRDRERPDLALGSNVAGVVVGGLSENLSLALGFDDLLWVAIAFYVLSALLGAGRGWSLARSAG